MVEPQREIPRSMIPWLGWGVAAFFIGATFVLLTTTNRARNELRRAEDRVATLTRGLDAERRWTVALAAPGVRTASFTLTPSGDAGLRARATVDPETRRALLVFQNFKAPGGRDYQLWALRGNTPVALGLIRADSSGRAVLRVQDIGDPATLSAFAISLEPEGGAPPARAPSEDASTPAPELPATREPTGPIVMIGSLGG
jgi:hypothetical protein